MSTAVPFFRPNVTDAEIDEVVAALRSGWLTTGPRVKRFEEAFAEAVGAPHAVAVNSCTAALHLAVEALGLRAGEAVLVPTMTFAATAEVVRYLGAIPVLVDCDPVTLNMDLEDAERKLEIARGRRGRRRASRAGTKVVGIIPVHVGGLMMDIDAGEGVRRAPRSLGRRGRRARVSGGLAIVGRRRPWQRCGENTARDHVLLVLRQQDDHDGRGRDGGRPTDAELAERMRLMSLHGLSQDAWKRYSGGGQLGLPDRRAGLQVQPHRHRRRDRHPPARAGRDDAAAARGDRRRYASSFAGSDELELPATLDRPDPLVAPLPDPAAARPPGHRPRHRSSTSSRARRRVLGALAAAAPAPVLPETFGWRPEDLPRRHGGLAAARQRCRSFRA